MKAWKPIVALAFLLLVVACNMPPPTTSPIATADIATAVQATLTAAIGATATAAAPASTPPAGAPAGASAPGENGSAATAAATPTPAAGAASGQVEGMVWHDECAVEGGQNGEPLQTGPNCKKYPDWGYGGDGVKQPDETPIEGVEVRLAKGQCPGSPWLATLTDAQGHYVFPQVPPGEYCVFIDQRSAINGPLLIPGEWTYPAPGQGSQGVTVVAGQTVEANFGWFPSVVGFVSEACEQHMEFVSETVPDGSEVLPGTRFVKQWTVRNTGTCTWSKAYSLVHTDGESMGAPEAVPLPDVVHPGEEIIFEVEFTAPQSPGTYRSEWRLLDDKGNLFGPGNDPAKGRLWVEIEVPATTSTLNLGAPTVTDPMNSAAYWFLLQTNEASFEMQNGQLVMHGLTPGMLDSWGLSSYPVLGDAFVEATFITGGQCSGLDRYGLIVRAPNPSEGVVVEFSCDGRYRIYIWDGANFTPIKNWTHGASIVSGPNQTNRMGVWMQGNVLKVYANRVLLAEVNQNQYATGHFGLVIASKNTPNLTVAVDEVDYWTNLP